MEKISNKCYFSRQCMCSKIRRKTKFYKETDESYKYNWSKISHYSLLNITHNDLEEINKKNQFRNYYFAQNSLKVIDS